jgi:hypothetical protein
MTDRTLLPPMGVIHAFVTAAAGAGLALIPAFLIEPSLRPARWSNRLRIG